MVNGMPNPRLKDNKSLDFFGTNGIENVIQYPSSPMAMYIAPLAYTLPSINRQNRFIPSYRNSATKCPHMHSLPNNYSSTPSTTTIPYLTLHSTLPPLPSPLDI